jgi:lipooligosaccharide transport system permease protein
MSTPNLYAIPRPGLRWLPVWRRNFLVWRKLAIPSVLGNLADPLIYMLGLGYGLGGMLPQMNGVSYVAFLAAGTVVASTMNAATFEALYSSFSRMHVQKTWDAILNTPLSLDHVLRRDGPDRLRAGAVLRLLHVLLHAFHHADVVLPSRGGVFFPGS